MLNVSEYLTLKRKVEAAYLVLKKLPTPENASRYSTLNLKLQELCVSMVEDYVKNHNLSDDTSSSDILNNIDEYKTCKKCGSEILYQVSPSEFVASSDFVEDFPGWCYDCLLTHCSETDCGTCTLVTDPGTCTFRGVKDFSEVSE